MQNELKFGVIGSGSWATALIKILSDNEQHTNWWVRNPEQITFIQNRKHNPHYLSSARLETSQLFISSDVNEIVSKSNVLLLAVPSAFVHEVLQSIDNTLLVDKKIVSAIKGIVPGPDVLLNEYLQNHFSFRQDFDHYLFLLQLLK
jgi:glycerol-3-phosphate dehydrogenase (NAD(P)+)